MLVETINYVGPARVLDVDVPKVLLDLPLEQVWATLALPGFYEPNVEDTVLALGQGDDYYVVGVLNGTGKTTISVPGDLSLRAPSGSIDLVSTREIRLSAPHMKLRSNKLEILATSVRERFDRVQRYIKGALDLRAGSVRTRVEEDYEVRAERIVQCATKAVRIDGDSINIG